MGFVPYVCLQTNNGHYNETPKMQIKGVLWHSTGANNPWLCRYVQPTPGSANYNADIKKIGKNTNGSDWNRPSQDMELNAWIGKFDDGSIGTVQTMPWDYKPGGCGVGTRGLSCNSGWIQFEICEDDLTNKQYAEKVFEEACQLTAYLCRMYNLNPNGYANHTGVSVPVITCHNDAAKLGCAYNHADINHWFPKILGKDMNDVRKRVTAILNGGVTPTPTPRDKDLYQGELAYPVLSKGDDGYQVKNLQKFLNWFGSYGLDEDGIFGNATESALKDFQTYSKIEVDGIYGNGSYNAADKAKKKVVTPTPTPAPQPSSEYYTGKLPSVTLFKGDTGTDVKYLQEFLNWYGSYGLEVDGVYGLLTVNAVRDFQKNTGIEVDGIFGTNSRLTAQKTKKKTKKVYSGTLPTADLAPGDSGTQVKYLQQFLNWYGNYKLDIDGIYGNLTTTAVKSFQGLEAID